MFLLITSIPYFYYRLIISYYYTFERRKINIKRLWFRGRIDRCHRLDPGSSPGKRSDLFFLL